MLNKSFDLSGLIMNIAFPVWLEASLPILHLAGGI